MSIKEIGVAPVKFELRLKPREKNTKLYGPLTFFSITLA